MPTPEELEKARIAEEARKKKEEGVPEPGSPEELVAAKAELATERQRVKDAQAELTRKSQELAELQKNAQPKEPEPNAPQSWADYEAKARSDFDDDPVSTMLRMQLDNAAAREQFQKTVTETLTKAEDRQMRVNLQSDPNAKPTLELLDSLKTLPLHEQVATMQEFVNASGKERPSTAQLSAGGTDIAGALDHEPTKAERLAKDPESAQLVASGAFKDANDIAAWSEQHTTPKSVSDDLMGVRPEGE